MPSSATLRVCLMSSFAYAQAHQQKAGTPDLAQCSKMKCNEGLQLIGEGTHVISTDVVTIRKLELGKLARQNCELHEPAQKHTHPSQHESNSINSASTLVLPVTSERGNKIVRERVPSNPFVCFIAHGDSSTMASTPINTEGKLRLAGSVGSCQHVLSHCSLKTHHDCTVGRVYFRRFRITPLGFVRVLVYLAWYEIRFCNFCFLL